MKRDSGGLFLKTRQTHSALQFNVYHILDQRLNNQRNLFNMNNIKPSPPDPSVLTFSERAKNIVFPKCQIITFMLKKEPSKNNYQLGFHRHLGSTLEGAKQLVI